MQTDSNRSNPQLAAAVVRINAGEATDRITPAQGAAAALYGLASIFKQENDETGALAALALSLSLDAKLDASRILFAQIQGGLGNNAAAHAMLARIPGDSPYAAVSAVTEAWFLVDQGREEEALALARTAAATVAYFLSRQRDAVGLVTFEDRVVEYIPPRRREIGRAHV